MRNIFLVDALGRDHPLVRRDVNRVEEDILQVGFAIGAQDPNRVFDVARMDRIAALEKFVQLGHELAGDRLLGLAAANLERGAADPDPHLKFLLDRPDMGIVLPQQVGENPMVGEVQFERIFGR